MSVDKFFYGTGRRKTSTARVFLRPGSGKVTINKLPIEKYVTTKTGFSLVNQVFDLTNTKNQFDAFITVRGGGEVAQAGAIRHGLARALASGVEHHRDALKKASRAFC